MRRRQVIAALTVGVGALAGWASATSRQPQKGNFPPKSGSPQPPTANTLSPESRSTVADATPSALAAKGQPTTICARPIKSDFSIRGIADPAFARDWSDIEISENYNYHGAGLSDEASVIGVVRDGTARAYPLSVLAEHEVVNDCLNGPQLVTYCPLCRSGLVTSRRVKGEPTLFGVSGNLWRIDGSDYNLVLYDEATRSYWSQLLATSICGPMTGTELAQRPFSFTEWGAWERAHPETTVLLPPPHSSVM